VVPDGKTLIGFKVNIVFRTDASVQIGTGHVMRCLTLADALRETGANCTFVCRTHKGHLLDLIHQREHKVAALAERQSVITDTKGQSPSHTSWLGTDWASDAADTQQVMGEALVDWLIVDHYALDARWEKAMRPYCKQLMVIDDLADRRHDCDLLLDQNLGRSKDDYNSHISSTTATLIGPRYALLRPEFAALRKISLTRRRRPKLQRLLITLGGIDQNNITEHVLKALCNCNLPIEFQITVVMGAHSPWLSQIQATAQTMPCPTKVMVNVSDMAQLMAGSDLAISATGGTIWELCTLGIPTLSIAIAENQVANAFALTKARATQGINYFSIQQDLIELFAWLRVECNLAEIQQNAVQICDGLGTKRVVSTLME